MHQDLEWQIDFRNIYNPRFYLAAFKVSISRNLLLFGGIVVIYLILLMTIVARMQLSLSQSFMFLNIIFLVVTVIILGLILRNHLGYWRLGKVNFKLTDNGVVTNNVNYPWTSFKSFTTSEDLNRVVQKSARVFLNNATGVALSRPAPTSKPLVIHLLVDSQGFKERLLFFTDEEVYKRAVEIVSMHLDMKRY